MNNSDEIRASPQLTSVAMAIIYQDNQYLMQLRDDIPSIVYPGVWAFFGGHLELGESPEAGLRRELVEEINYRVKQLTEFRSYQVGNYVRHLFSCPLTVPIEELKLQEGWDLKLLTKAEIERGKAYSSQARAIKPVGDLHRQIMFDFMAEVAQK